MKKNYLLKKQLWVVQILLFGFSSAFSQMTIQGKVTSNADGETMPGVSIIVKGTSQGTITDIDGQYTINASSGQTLIFSFLGFKTVEKVVDNQTTIDVSLVEDATKLDEVVVVGYGTARRSDLTGALTSISAKDFDKQPLNNVSQALQGRAAGVQVTQTSGAPGGGFKIRIRGANSITGGNEPLYVVDGQFVDISAVNVNDIASMEVLKDASATAIYGTRGANGVVLITTKSGSKGKAKITIDAFSGYADVTQKLPLMNAYDFALGVNFAEGRNPNDPNLPFSQAYSQAELDALRANGGEDWQKRLFQTARFNNAQIAASGGNESTDYYISGNFYETTGTVLDQYFRRLNLRANFNTKLSQKVKVGLNFNVRNEVLEGERADLAVGLSFDPTTPAFDKDGNYNFNSLKKCSYFTS